VNKTPIAQEITARVAKWDCIKNKSFFPAKETNYQNLETKHRMGAIHQYRLIFRIRKELKNLNTKEQTIQLEGVHGLNIKEI
jgi:hypothetical protein